MAQVLLYLKTDVGTSQGEMKYWVSLGCVSEIVYLRGIHATTGLLLLVEGAHKTCIDYVIIIVSLSSFL